METLNWSFFKAIWRKKRNNTGEEKKKRDPGSSTI